MDTPEYVEKATVHSVPLQEGDHQPRPLYRASIFAWHCRPKLVQAQQPTLPPDCKQAKEQHRLALIQTVVCTSMKFKPWGTLFLLQTYADTPHHSTDRRTSAATGNTVRLVSKCRTGPAQQLSLDTVRRPLEHH